jgi:hypothetical protein
MLIMKMSDAYNFVFSDAFASSVKRIRKKDKKLYDIIKRELQFSL